MRQRHWIPLLAVALLSLAYSLPVYGQATPLGSYLQSCNSARMHGTTLIASCKDRNGNPQAASLAVPGPASTTSPIPTEYFSGTDFPPYKAACSAITLQKDKEGIPYLLAICPNGVGQDVFSKLIVAAGG